MTRSCGRYRLVLSVPFYLSEAPNVLLESLLMLMKKPWPVFDNICESFFDLFFSPVFRFS